MPHMTRPVVEMADVQPSRDVFSCERGQVVIEWPQEMTATDYEFGAEWLAMIHHRIKRQVAPPTQPESNRDDK